ncbi:MAG: glycosyltransferase [bacterium]|nr:glycosyltransferase [bacterium]
MYLSVIIPCYNEETNIRNGVLHVVTEYLDSQDYQKEVIIVDDGSDDQSVKLIEKYIKQSKKDYVKLIKNPHGGKASTVITGMLAGEGDIVLFTDMDQATPIEETSKLLPFFDQGYDIVIGSRAGERKGAPIIRRAMSRGFFALRLLIVGLNFRDTQCGFKAFKRDVARKLFTSMKIHGTRKIIKGSTVTAGFDVEFLFIARKMGYKMKEVPVKWHYVGTKRVNAIKESWRGLKELVNLKVNDIRGVYNQL